MKLTKKQAILYQQRWRQVESMQSRELQTTPMSLKFKQLCWLMNSFRLQRTGHQRQKEVDAARKRWIAIRKNGGNVMTKLKINIVKNKK